MTAHEPPHLARALLDVERQLTEERQRREQAEAELAAARAVITHLRETVDSLDAEESQRIQALEAELAALRRAGEGA